MRDQRVVIVDLPRVMREIIRQFLTDAGVAIVAETSRDVNLAELVEATRADVVVMGLEKTRLPAAGQRLLLKHPRIRLVGVGADGRNTVTYELGARRRSLGEVSPDALVAAVRGGRTRGTLGDAEVR